MNTKVGSLSAMRREKRKRQRRAMLIKCCIALGIICMCSALVWLLFFSSVFRYHASDFEVSGITQDSAITEQRVQAILKRFDGEQMFATRSSHIEQAVEEIPEVDVADVQRVLFHGLDVTIKEKTPIATTTKNGVRGALAADGTFVSVTQERSQKLPHIRIEDDAPNTAKVMQGVVHVLTAMPDSVRSHITEIKVGTGMQLTFTADAKRKIIWGTDDDNQNKAKILVILWKGENTLIDVSIPAAPVTQ